MAFFVLIPFYWLTSIILYAASPRQQINKLHDKALLPISIAWGCFFVINGASIIWLSVNGWSMIVVSTILLLLNMLMVPLSIILLAHQPHKLKHSTFIIIFGCVLAQLVWQRH